MAGEQDRAASGRPHLSSPDPVRRPARRPAPRSFFAREPLVVAPALLGCVLECERDGELVAVRLTEVEAYLGEGEDPASHSHRGRTARNAVMFGPPGHCYVYFTYGMHWCANVTCRQEGVSGGVLLRAGEVVRGLAVARSRRPAAKRDADLARGPARLATALALTGADNGRDFCAPGSQLRIRRGHPVPAAQVMVGPRVGVNVGVASPWRYWIAGDPTVSAFKPGVRKRRPKPDPA